MRTLFAALVCLSLLACGTSSPDLNGAELDGSKHQTPEEFSAFLDELCDSYPSGSVDVSVEAGQTCLDCSSASPELSMDGTDQTYATLNYGAGDRGPLRVRVSSIDGAEYPAGMRPAVTFSAADNETDYRVDVRTYLQGELQQAECYRGAYFNAEDRNVFGIDADLPFDAFEFELLRDNLDIATTDCGTSVLSSSNVHNLAYPSEIRVHEFCMNFQDIDS